MPTVAEIADELWMSFGDPSEHKTGSLHFVLGKKLEQTLHSLNDSTLEGLPSVARDVRLERRHLEVFLDVDREMVTDVGRPLSRYALRQQRGGWQLFDDWLCTHK
jgi:hypothetical protein